MHEYLMNLRSAYEPHLLTKALQRQWCNQNARRNNLQFLHGTTASVPIFGITRSEFAIMHVASTNIQMVKHNWPLPPCSHHGNHCTVFVLLRDSGTVSGYNLIVEKPQWNVTWVARSIGVASFEHLTPSTFWWLTVYKNTHPNSISVHV